MGKKTDADAVLGRRLRAAVEDRAALEAAIRSNGDDQLLLISEGERLRHELDNTERRIRRLLSEVTQ